MRSFGTELRSAVIVEPPPFICGLLLLLFNPTSCKSTSLVNSLPASYTFRTHVSTLHERHFRGYTVQSTHHTACSSTRRAAFGRPRCSAIVFQPSLPLRSPAGFPARFLLPVAKLPKLGACSCISSPSSPFVKLFALSFLSLTALRPTVLVTSSSQTVLWTSQQKWLLTGRRRP